MKTISTIASAWDFLLLSPGTAHERVARSLKRLIGLSTDDLSNNQLALYETLPLNKIQSFGEVEIERYVNSLSNGTFREIINTIARMHCLDGSDVRQ